MTQGSGGGPADRNDTEAVRASGDVGDGGGASGSGAAPRTEGESESEGESEAEGESESETAPETEGSAGPSGTKLGDAGEVAREAQARKEMDWLMTVSPEASGLRKIVTEHDEAPVPPPPPFRAVPLGGDEDFFGPEAQTRPDIVPTGVEVPTQRGPASASGEFEATADLDLDVDPDESTPKAEVRVGSSRTQPGRVSGPDARETREDVEVPQAKGKPPVDGDGFERVLTTGRAANTRPADALVEEASSGGGGRGIWIAGIVVVGAVAAFLGLREGDEAPTEIDREPKVAGLEASPEDPPEPTPTRDRTTHSDVTPPEPAPRDGGAPAKPMPPEDATKDATEDATKDAPGDPPEPEPEPRSADPRQPPPGTPDDIAAVFEKIPVSPSDRPPVGGVGGTGVHIDRIDMGVDRKCTGEGKTFSLSRGDRPSVCIRVVHQRQQEELAVLWEKKGGATRRSKLTVKPLHAYRTRAYLVLRQEYLGDWTVRLESSDGVELASYDFSVVD